MTRFETVLLVGAACAIIAGDAFAVGTPAGTSISNQAQVSYTLNGTPANGVSNTVAFNVDEILDLNITLLSSTVNVVPGDIGRVLLFRVTNTGNGPEALPLAVNDVVAGDDFDPIAVPPTLFFDNDASGDLSPSDAIYVPGVNDPVLAPDASVAVLVVNTIPTGLADGAIGRSQLTGRAATGTGTPGTVFPGQGVGGTNAVVGAQSAQASATGEYLVGNVSVAMVKSATVTDPFGGTTAVPGASIAYQIVVTVTGTGTAAGFAVDDPIPVNTTFVPGSLRLNGLALSDVADADAGEFQGGGAARIRVRLGDLTQAAGAQTLAFSVTIN
jgi:uncharacterized repeat protein (TIGR01451 family)